MLKNIYISFSLSDILFFHSDISFPLRDISYSPSDISFLLSNTLFMLSEISLTSCKTNVHFFTDLLS